MDKIEVAVVLSEIATLLELKGENPFKCNAYRAASRAVEKIESPLEEFQKPEDFAEIKGIGKSLAPKIIEMIKTGNLPYFYQLKSSIPPGLITMTSIPRFGPKKARIVYEKLGIASLEELETACRENRLLELPGFGIRSQNNILKGIEFYKKHRGRYHLSEARTIAANIQDYLKQIPGVQNMQLTGSLRRFRETVKDIDILVTSTDRKSVV